MCLDNDESHTDRPEENVASGLGFEADEKALPCAERVEAPDAFKTLAHGFNAKLDESIRVGRECLD